MARAKDHVHPPGKIVGNPQDGCAECVAQRTYLKESGNTVTGARIVRSLERLEDRLAKGRKS